MMFHKSQ